MKLYLIKLSCFMGIFILMLYGLDFAITNGLKKGQDNTYNDWNMIFNGSINSDIVILGSSRAWIHIDPEKIEKATGLSCYNLGIEGGFTFMQQAKWNSYLKYNSFPKLVIQSVDLVSMKKRDTIYERRQFLPYLNEDAVYQPLTNIESGLWLDRYLPFYRYHGNFDIIVQGINGFLGRKIVKHIQKYKGFAYKDIVWDGSFEKMRDGLKEGALLYNREHLELGLSHINNLADLCKKNNAHLILLYTPVYHELIKILPQKVFIDSAFQKIADQHEFEYWDYTGDSLGLSKTNFYNSLHMNRTGASQFSSQLAQKLTKYLKKNNTAQNLPASK